VFNIPSQPVQLPERLACLILGEIYYLLQYKQFRSCKTYFFNLLLLSQKRRTVEKIRPCVALSPDEMNFNIDTVIIAPMTTKSRSYPTRIKITFENKIGWIVLDQIRAIDKIRLKEKAGCLKEAEITEVKSVLKEMLID